MSGYEFGTAACPRCGAQVARDQDWCLECGYAARTTIARTPRWRAPIIAAAAVAAIALGLLAVAFVDLTDDPGGVTVPTTAPTVLTGPPATTTTAAPAPPATTAP